MSSPATSCPEAYDLAVVALSARALAVSARRGGLKALAVDLFADSDTREHAEKAVRAPSSGMGFSRRGLLTALTRHAPAGLPVVLGSGLEHDPELIAAINQRNPILGASAAIVSRLKDPFAFASLLADIGASHPEVARPLDSPTGDWLSKRIGGSGGAHIRRGRRSRGNRRYLQRRTAGEPLSALFLADGKQSRIIGFSAQWTDPAPSAPFRYGGAVGPIEVPAALSKTVSAALDGIIERTGLTGLASADMLRAPDGGVVLLEINPRPGATLDVFDRSPAPSLLGLHLDACAGRLPETVALPSTAQAAAVIYAARPVAAALLQRPLWTADWPACEETIPAGAPVCTILAAGADPTAARALLEERRAAFLEQLRAAATGPSQTTMVHA
ncbi:ATP-grasp domain-containing protein [Hansschlegelia quercus]|uniref:ATP-grasp domain-containing protein n=1 Tax=Hansschlegelia quercus TaxID=2528245 RepID=A0A4Q9GJT0_9HYPH|nr:ATP-grasp domain-containing protein [Hansschlegelia quercus]TBN54523.1 ATP-grasp domain-containing protein [Hansschlegelia quercus]